MQALGEVVIVGFADRYRFLPRERPIDSKADKPSATLVLVAAQAEADAVCGAFGAAPPAHAWKPVPLTPGADLVLTGVGKANAAGAAASALTDRHHGLLTIGLAGALPGSGLTAGDLIVADACILADEGMIAPDGFHALSDMGHPTLPGRGERFPTCPRWLAALGVGGARVGACATVSTCSATDSRATEIARRTGAIVEDMESAAVALVAARTARRVACVRVVSNRTGDRDRQGWDLGLALSVLARAARDALAV